MMAYGEVSLGTHKGIVTKSQIFRIIDNLQLLVCMLENMNKPRNPKRIYIRIEQVKEDINSLKELF